MRPTALAACLADAKCGELEQPALLPGAARDGIASYGLAMSPGSNKTERPCPTERALNGRCRAFLRHRPGLSYLLVVSACRICLADPDRVAALLLLYGPFVGDWRQTYRDERGARMNRFQQERLFGRPALPSRIRVLGGERNSGPWHPLQTWRSGSVFPCKPSTMRGRAVAGIARDRPRCPSRLPAPQPCYPANTPGQ
jgi:hypothetical protein